MGFLTELVTELRLDLAAHPLDRVGLGTAADGQPAARDVAAALGEAAGTDGVALIAEVKRASPSAGSIVADADPVAQARAYDAAGASVVSVLTEPTHFGGSLDDLRAVRAAVDLPVLRKDFLIDTTQVLQSRAAGADTVLLIAASVDDEALTVLLAAARDLGMEPLVESHTDEDLDRVLATDARIVGVNARDLESLEVDVAGALERMRRIPSGRIAVFESGIRSRDDVARAVDAGASAILVGETLMRAGDPAAAARVLLGREERTT
ncbi:MAG TPA: indole-3-glycerol phosphate synthase TrpC [Actinomycetota bacterium]|jgi:indole-3-glycerol phosphate synthase|nr:indole-3-glycerol phosphate synthase TrpC [Actinomycetota bacterium]